MSKMASTPQIIHEIQNTVNADQPLDFIGEWKGVPVMVRAHIRELRPESILFELEPPDSICLKDDSQVLILSDRLMTGIQGQILALDLPTGRIEVGALNYVDRGFGERAIVRVQPQSPIPAQLRLPDGTAFSCRVIDLSFSGFGLLAQVPSGVALSQGQAITLELRLLGQALQIPATLVGVFLQPGGEVRLALSFTADAPGSAAIIRYISRRRAEIRQEVRDAYQRAVEPSP